MGMMINPSRFAVPGDWTAYHDLTNTVDHTGYQNYTMRTAFLRGNLPAGASKVRVTLDGGVGHGTKVGKVYIGKSRALIFDAAPTQVLFGGAAGATIAAGGTLVSDDIPFDYDGGGDLCLSVYIASDAGVNGVARGFSDFRTYTCRQYGYGDQAASTGGSWAGAQGSYVIRKLELYSGGLWTNVFKSVGDSPATGWSGYTLRTKYDVGLITSAKANLRLLIGTSFTDCFIGEGNATPNNVDFVGTPVRVTFGGANGVTALDYAGHGSDDIDTSLLNFSAPLVLSYHTNTGRVRKDVSGPAGTITRYLYGNSAGLTGSFSGSSSTNYSGAQAFDEK